jgi:hypothetical protein
LILCSGGYVATDREICQECLDFRLSKPRRIRLAAMPNEPMQPTHVGPFGRQCLVSQSQLPPHLLNDKWPGRINQPNEVPFVANAGAFKGRPGRFLLLGEPTQHQMNVAHIHRIYHVHERLVGLDRSHRLQPLPGGRAVIAERPQKLNNLSLNHRKAAARITATGRIPANPTGKLFLVGPWELRTCQNRTKPSHAHSLHPARHGRTSTTRWHR